MNLFYVHFKTYDDRHFCVCANESKTIWMYQYQNSFEYSKIELTCDNSIRCLFIRTLLFAYSNFFFLVWYIWKLYNWNKKRKKNYEVNVKECAVCLTMLTWHGNGNIMKIKTAIIEETIDAMQSRIFFRKFWLCQDIFEYA